MEISITTGKGTTDVTELVTTAKWSGDKGSAARSLSFSLLSSPTDKSIPAADCPLGAGVRLYHGGRLLFDGFLVERTKSTGGSVMELNCFDRGFYLKRNKASYLWRDIQPEAAAAAVAADFGLAVGELAKTGVTVSRSFLGVSLYDILLTLYTLASRETKKQYYIGFLGEKLSITPREPDERTLILRGESNLIAATATESIEKLVSAVALYDPAGKLVRVAEDAERIKLYGRLQEAVTQTKNDDKTKDAEKLMREGDLQQTITVDCLGNTANVSGGTVVVQEPYTGVYGLFYIESDTHEWKRGQYYNKLTLSFQNLMEEREAGSLPNAGGQKTAAATDETTWKPIK